MPRILCWIGPSAVRGPWWDEARRYSSGTPRAICVCSTVHRLVCRVACDRANSDREGLGTTPAICLRPGPGAAADHRANSHRSHGITGRAGGDGPPLGCVAPAAGDNGGRSAVYLSPIEANWYCCRNTRSQAVAARSRHFRNGVRRNRCDSRPGVDQCFAKRFGGFAGHTIDWCDQCPWHTTRQRVCQQFDETGRCAGRNSAPGGPTRLGSHCGPHRG